MSGPISSTGAGKTRAGLPRRALRGVVLLGLLGAGVWFGWQWWQERAANVFVIDARIASDMVTVSAADAGVIRELTVRPGDRVRRGQLLARLDARELDLRIEEIANEIAAIDAQRVRALAERRLIDARATSGVAVAEASVAMSSADHRASLTMHDKARKELERSVRLFRTRVISSQARDDARATFDNAAERARQAEAAVAEAGAKLGAANVERSRLEVLDADVAVLDAERATLDARRRQFEVRRSDREINSEIDGIIDQTFVEAGEYLRPGTRMLMLHDPRNVWIAANVKETELGRFAVGAAVDVSVDAFPGRVVRGQVTWIGPSATSQFALLPNPNPSGNFTKVTQRVPIRVDLDDAPAGLSPGMMVELRIDATTHD